MTWVQTYSGLALDLIDPHEDQVCSEDIGHALSMQCRFNGHCRVFYSVAEHSCRVAELVPHGWRLEALLHDAAEAYVGDLTSPLKGMVPGFRDIERSVLRVITKAFGARMPPSAVKHADLVMLATEKRDLMAPEPREWIELPEPALATIKPWSQQVARDRYLKQLREAHAARLR